MSLTVLAIAAVPALLLIAGGRKIRGFFSRLVVCGFVLWLVVTTGAARYAQLDAVFVLGAIAYLFLGGRRERRGRSRPALTPTNPSRTHVRPLDSHGERL